MSRKYEGLIVLNTKGQDASVEELVSAVGKELEAEGAKLEEVEQMGRKDFVYNARKLEAGYYVNYSFEAEPDVISKATERLKLNKTVFLQHYQRLS